MEQGIKTLEHLIKYHLIPKRMVVTFRDAIKLTGSSKIQKEINFCQEFKMKYSPFLVKELPNGTLWIPTMGSKYDNAFRVLTNAGIEVNNASELGLDIHSIKKPQEDASKLLERHDEKIFLAPKHKFCLGSYGYKLPLPQIRHLFYTDVEKTTGKQKIGISPDLGIHLDKPTGSEKIADGKYSKSDHFYELLVRNNGLLDLTQAHTIFMEIAKSQMNDNGEYVDNEYNSKSIDNKIRQTVRTINQKLEPLIRGLEKEFGTSFFSYAKKPDPKNRYNFIIIENQVFSFNYSTNCFSRFLLLSDSYLDQNHHQNLIY